MQKLIIVAIVSLLAWVPNSALATDVGPFGGSAGAPFHTPCAANSYLVGFEGRVGAWIDQMTPVCAAIDPITRHLGGHKSGTRAGASEGGRPVSALCPPDTIVQQLTFNTTRGDGPHVIQNLGVTCVDFKPPHAATATHPELRSDSGPGDPPIYLYVTDDSQRSAFLVVNCPPFELATGILGRGGLFVDALGLICGPPPEARPNLAPILPAVSRRVVEATAKDDQMDSGLVIMRMRPGAPMEAPILRGVIPEGVQDLRGDWNTSEGEMILTQGGQRVEGTYGKGRGRVSGEVRGNQLVGYWAERKASQRCSTPLFETYYWGRVLFTLNAEGNHFDGLWSKCDAAADSGSPWSGDLIHR